jgi:uncharacterized surface anchored protein
MGLQPEVFSMSVLCLRRSKALIWPVLAVFAVFLMPARLGAGSGGAAPGPGSLTGFIYGKDVKTPVAGAVVKIRNLSDEKELASQPSDANGVYAIKDIPEGRYILGVTSAKDDFNLDYEIYVKGGEVAKLSIALAADASKAGGQEGGVQVGENATKKKGFFRTTAGRILVVAAVGVALYFLIVPENSPIR